MIIAPDSPAFCSAAQDLSVVGIEHAGVGHEQLEAGDPLVVDEVGHRLQGVLVDSADDLVEAVVDGAVAGGLGVPVGEPVLDVLTRALDGEVDDRRDASPGRGDRAGLERVGRGRAAERQLHVGVHVDTPGNDVLPGGVDHLRGGRCFGIAGLPTGDPESLGLARSQHGGDRLTVDQDVSFDATGRADDRAAVDERPRHCSTISS